MPDQQGAVIDEQARPPTLAIRDPKETTRSDSGICRLDVHGVTDQQNTFIEAPNLEPTAWVPTRRRGHCSVEDSPGLTDRAHAIDDVLVRSAHRRRNDTRPVDELLQR
ncbi:hypothetical protein [Nocardia callitridis]|uniref:hypothetical protein n=1 Tax=Nocardia callitridis TaxID=648753 RepID=UPI0031EFD8E4